MSTLTVELSDELASELGRFVASGRYSDVGDAVRAALRELLAAQRSTLLERQQLEDIAWAVKLSRAPAP